jgi:ATP-dependent DNA ligase
MVGRTRAPSGRLRGCRPMVSWLGQSKRLAGGLIRFAITAGNAYFEAMPKFEFCIPTNGKAVPSGPEWFHEIKYDGYRLRVERNGDRVRLITRNGYDWTNRYPWIVEAARKNRMKQLVIDGEAGHSRRRRYSRWQRRAIPDGDRRGATASGFAPVEGYWQRQNSR